MSAIKEKETGSTTFLKPEHWDAMLITVRKKEYRQLIQQFRDCNNSPIARKDFQDFPDMPISYFQDSIRDLGLGIRFLRKKLPRYRDQEFKGDQLFHFVVSK